MSRRIELPVPESLDRYLGSKRWLPKAYPALLPPPSRGGSFYEGFVGGGAIAFHYAKLGCRLVLGDANPRLIGAYHWIQRDPERIAAILHGFALAHAGAGDRAKEVFVLLREAMNASTPDSALSAAGILYVIRAGFNGIYRVNRKGVCNTPWGNPKPGKDFARRLELLGMQRALRRATFRCGDFEETVAPARRGDFAFFDPPYVGDAGSGDFVGYAAGGWTERDRKRLGSVLRDLDRRGVRFLLSDREGTTPRSVYGLWHVIEATVERSVSAKPSGRGSVTELLVANF